MSEIKNLQQAWQEESDAADEYLARHYAGSGKEDEIRSLNEAQVKRLCELYCGPLEAMEDTRWLAKASAAGNPFAKALFSAAQDPVANVEEKPAEKKEETAAAKKEPKPAAEPKPKKKKKGGFLLAFFLILLAAGLIGGYMYYRNLNATVEIDPVPYMSWEVSGRDGSGTATASIDAPAMSADSNRIVDGDVISLYISKDQGLSNGDVITLEIVVNEENAARNHVAFTRTKTEFTVEGLEELEKVDVFDEIEVSFTGENGKGVARVVSTSDDPFLSKVTYVCEPAENLSIGDVIMVRAVITPEMSKTYGKTAEEFERDATVVSLSRYPVSMDEFSDVAYGTLYEKASASVRKTIFADSLRYSQAADPGGKTTLANMSVQNMWPSAIYIVSPGDSSGRGAQFHNRIILIMHVQASDSAAARREFFCPVIFENVLINDTEVLSLQDLTEQSEAWLHGAGTAQAVYEDLVAGYTPVFWVVGKTLE